MKILSLSTVYPNPDEPGLGLFVRSRLQALAVSEEVKVIAPVPLLDYANPEGRVLPPRTVPFSRSDGAIEVFHPRWAYPPLGTPLNVACMFLRLLPLVRRIRRCFPFDVIDAHFGYPEGAAAALLAAAFRVPFTITLRGSEKRFAEAFSRRLITRWAYRRAAHVITVSQDLREFVIGQGAAPGRVTVIPNGIEAARFFPRPRKPSRRKVLLSAGELIEAKGHHHVIDALRHVLALGWDAELRIVGSVARGGRGYEQELHQSVARLGLQDRVRFIGWVDRNGMAELLAAADVFCLASFTEGWPNVVHEALACGTPVVATRVGGIPDLVPSERYGFLVPPQAPDLFGKALARALETSWDRAAVSAWGGSRSWEQVAQEAAAVFHSVAARPVRVAGGTFDPSQLIKETDHVRD